MRRRARPTQYPTFKNLRISGKISAVRFGQVPKMGSKAILIMGPTGTGKSSFIEALAQNKHLQIAKDQLESVTQQIAAYKMVNVSAVDAAFYNTNMTPREIFVLDCPGFADSKISEKEIVEMVRRWMHQNRIHTFDHILYFSAITDTRLPASKRKAIALFKALTRTDEPSLSLQPGRPLTIVTTMWDSVCTPSMRKRAFGNWKQLKEGVWKQVIQEGAQITKFLNTQESALGIINNALGTRTGILDRDTLSGPRAQSHRSYLYQDLMQRIDLFSRERSMLEYDLTQPDTQANRDLVLLLEARFQETTDVFTKLSTQLEEFDSDAPILPVAYGPIQIPDRTSRLRKVVGASFRWFARLYRKKPH